jgi:hypothetical protein
VLEKYNQTDVITNPVKYAMSTALEPNRSANIPAGNPPNPRKRICIVTSCPREINETENSFSKMIRMTGRIIVMACTKKCPMLVITIFFCK